MVFKVCCLGFQVVTLQLLRVGPFAENLPVAGLNEEDLREAVRERLREDYADVFGDRDRDQKRRRPAESTGENEIPTGSGGIWMMATVGGLGFQYHWKQSGVAKTLVHSGYIYIIHGIYIIYSFFMKGALLTFAVHCFAVFWQDPSHPRYCNCWIVLAGWSGRRVF